MVHPMVITRVIAAVPPGPAGPRGTASRPARPAAAAAPGPRGRRRTRRFDGPNLGNPELLLKNYLTKTCMVKFSLADFRRVFVDEYGSLVKERFMSPD